MSAFDTIDLEGLPALPSFLREEPQVPLLGRICLNQDESKALLQKIQTGEADLNEAVASYQFYANEIDMLAHITCELKDKDMIDQSTLEIVQMDVREHRMKSSSSSDRFANQVDDDFEELMLRLDSAEQQQQQHNTMMTMPTTTANNSLFVIAKKPKPMSVHTIFAHIMHALQHQPTKTLPPLSKMDADEAALLSYASYAFPTIALPSNYDPDTTLDNSRLVISSDLFSLASKDMADIHKTIPALPTTMIDVTQMFMIGNGVYGSVYQLQTTKNNDLARVCFKIQDPDQHNQMSKDTILKRTLLSPLTPAMLSHAKTNHPKANVPVPDGYRVGYFSQECLALFALNQLFDDWEAENKPMINQQRWSEWVPRLYGSFLTQTPSSKSFACVSIMQYMDGYITLEDYLKKNRTQMADIKKALQQFFAELEGPPLYMHNFDCHRNNILIHPVTNAMCLIDLAFTCFVMPLQYFCTFRESFGLQSHLEERCMNDGIPLVCYYISDERSAFEDRPMHGYNMGRAFSEDQMFKQYQESVYHLPILQRASNENKAQIRHSFGLQCSYSDVRLLSSVLYLDTNHRFERLTKRYLFFSKSNQHIHQDLFQLLNRNIPFCVEYEAIRAWKNRFFEFDDFVFNSSRPELVGRGLDANHQFERMLMKLAQSNLLMFVLCNFEVCSSFWSALDDVLFLPHFEWDVRKQYKALKTQPKSDAAERWLQRIKTVMNSDFCDVGMGRLVIAMAIKLLASGLELQQPVSAEDVPMILKSARQCADSESDFYSFFSTMGCVTDDTPAAKNKIFHHLDVCQCLSQYMDEARQVLWMKLGVYFQRKTVSN